MGIDDIKNLIREVSQADIDTFEYEENNTRVYISKNSGGINVSENISTEKNITKTDIADINMDNKEENINEKEIISPLVGTVYLAPGENEEPFVSVGDKIEKGQIVAIVEAMKLMNEIEADCSGTLKKICVKNGEAVEYAQSLFIIEE